MSKLCYGRGNRPIKTTENRVPPQGGSGTAKPGFVTKDSGARQTFDSGAVRDIEENKGAYELIPPLALKRLAQLYERGAKKYKERNWEAGMPFGRTLQSCIRHAFDYLDGDDTEDHLAAVVWNAFALMFYEEKIKQGKLPASLQNIPARQPKLEVTHYDDGTYKCVKGGIAPPGNCA